MPHSPPHTNMCLQDRVGPGWKLYMQWVSPFLLQYFCLENPMGGGAWWAAVYGVAQSRTRLKQLNSSSSKGLRAKDPAHFVGASQRGYLNKNKTYNKLQLWDFPGGPVVKALSFHCQGQGVQSLVGELRSHIQHGQK